MRKYLLATVASVLVSSPAVAKDGSIYIGADLGAAWPKSQNVDGAIDFTDTRLTDIAGENIGRLKYKAGIDVDMIGGYDFGMFRLEGEIGYKHGKVKTPDFASAFVTAINNA